MLFKRHRVLLWYMVGMMPFLDSTLYSIGSIFLCAYYKGTRQYVNLLPVKR